MMSLLWQVLLRPWAKSVKESLILIDSELLDDEDSLDSSSSDDKPVKKKGGGRGGMMDLAPPKVFTAEILDSCTPLTSAAAGVNESLGCVRLSGCLAGLAFVHSKVSELCNPWMKTFFFSSLNCFVLVKVYCMRHSI